MPNQLPIIPEYITVHLGAPDAEAQNITLPFQDYIKNVASSEIFPTWPEAALRANIYAQISYTLNRIYTEYYPSRGYDFDITNDISRDQSFVYGREIFENISQIVDEIFNSYIRTIGTIEPLYAVYCDGIEVTCDGLSQWGTVSLAEEGSTAFEILQNYYGNNIELVTNAPVGDVDRTAPDAPLRLGLSGPLVQQIQRRINRISRNYPAIPKIYPTDGVFDTKTEEAVKKFQEVFNLTPDGIVGSGTWYRIQTIYNSVKRLSDLNSEGLTYEDIETEYPKELQEGDEGIGVQVLQYYLSYIGNFVGTVPRITVDGDFGPATTASVRAFQTTYGLASTGVVDQITYNTLYNVYRGLVDAQDAESRDGLGIPFPGEILRLGAEGEAVTILQGYLNTIAQSYTELPSLPQTGYFGTQTAEAIEAFQRLFNLPGTPGVVNAAIWGAIVAIYEDVYAGNTATAGQFPGYEVGGTT